MSLRAKMPLETASFIPDLDSANPAATDLLSQGDDHIRLIKAVLQATFPNFTGEAITLTEADINGLESLISGGGVPTGTISLWYGLAANVPSGYGICNGTVYAKTDGSGNITSPDLRDKVVIGVGTLQATAGGSHGASTASATSGAGGAHTHTLSGDGAHTHAATIQGHALTISEMPAHTHSITQGGAGSVNGAGGTGGTTVATGSAGGGASHTHGITFPTDGIHTHTMGAAVDHTHGVTVSTYQPAIALHYIMKL